MTDEQRAALRRAIESLVRLVPHIPRPMVNDIERASVVYLGSVGPRLAEFHKAPELTPRQQLALSVLVGEPDSVITNALADMLIDAGHEYATAVGEKAWFDERERIAGLLHGEAANLLGRRAANDMDEYAAGALQTVADGLLVTVPK